MRRARTRTGVAALAVVLAVLLSAVAPAAALGAEEADSGTAIGDHLRGEESSGDSDSSDDSTASDDESADGSADASTNDSDDDSSTADDSDGGSTEADSTDSADSEASDDGSTTDSDQGNASTPVDVRSLADTASNETTDALSAADGSTTPDAGDALSTPTGVVGDGPATDGLDDRAMLLLELEDSEFAASDGLADDTTLSASLEAKTETVTDEATGLLAGVGVTAPDGDREEPPRADRGGSAAVRQPARPSSNAVGGAPGADDEESLPPAPSSGLAVGVGAVAVAAVGRNGTLLSGIAANLGPTLTAGLAPVASRSGAFDRLLRMLAPLRYSRYDDSDPLEHEARADVYEVVDAAPGAYLSEVAERVGLPLSTVRHHVRVLEREDLVSGAKVRGKRRFYPAYTSDIELAAALDDEATAAVIDAVARFGAASVSDLADDLGRDPSTISHHLKRLEEDDIVVRERDGRAVMNKLSPEARTALDPGRDPETEGVEVGEALASD